MRRAELTNAMQACYSLVDSEGEWLRGLTRALAPFLDYGYGVGAWAFRSGTWAGGETPLPVGVDDATARRMWETAPHFSADELVRVFLGPRVRSATERLGIRVGLTRHPGVGKVLGPLKIEDYRGISVLDPAGRGVAIVGESPRVLRTSAQTEGRLERLAAHVLAGFRLRHALAGAEAVFEPNGKNLHAEGEAIGHRDALRAAVKAFDRAHSRRAGLDPDEALAAWAALVAGRWSIVEQFESDGRRFLVAKRNPPGTPDGVPLTPIEAHALILRAQAVAYKVMRYELGLSEAALHGHVQAAMGKLGIASEAELPRLFAALAASARGAHDRGQPPRSMSQTKLGKD